MSDHLGDLIRTLRQAQREIAAVKEDRQADGDHTEDIEDIEAGLKWVRKKIEKLQSDRDPAN